MDLKEDRKLIASVIVIIAVIGVAYLAFYGPTGLAVMPPASDGGDTGSGGGEWPIVAPPTGGDTGGGTGDSVTPPATTNAVGSYTAAASAAAADSALLAAWVEQTTWCGEAYRNAGDAVTQVVELDFANNAISCMVSPRGDDRWYNTLISYQPMGIDEAFTSSLGECDASVVAEYENLLRGQASAFGAELSLSENCATCSSAYAVHLFCQPIRGFGIIKMPQNAIAFVDKVTGNVYN